MQPLANEQKWTKTQLSVFFIILLLTVDELNPVKLILHVFPNIKQWHIAVVSVVVMAYIFVSDFKELVYTVAKTFCNSILNVFFREVEVIGRENIPPYGPVLFSINHANQFVDACSCLCTCQRKISYLMAEASYNRRIIGDIAWALGVVPVKRAQDEARTGKGKIEIGRPTPNAASDTYGEISADGGGNDEVQKQELEIKGVETQFTKELVVGDKIRPPNTWYGLKIKKIESDSSMMVDASGIPDDFPYTDAGEAVTYDILKQTPLDVVFSKIVERLAEGGAVGIFPEGGSHDRTDLLPLKVGIALIAYFSLEKDGLNVPIIPVGLNYFRAHRWRGRAVVEYGQPIYVDPSTLDDFKAGGAKRRDVCNALLEEIEYSMRSVIVSTTDYDTLELIHTARRLYRSKKGKMLTSQKQDLSRRFAEGYRRLLLMTDGKPPPEWLSLQDRVMAYRRELRDLGLKDYQVPAIGSEHLDGETSVDADTVLSGLQLFYHIVHLMMLLALVGIPWIFLNLPVRIFADVYAESRRKKALARSKVKIRGFDVMLSEKVVFCLVMVPTLWIVYAVMLCLFTNLDGPTIALLILCMPLFAYVGIVVSDHGMVDVQDLRPYFMRLFPSSRKRLAALPGVRKNLQDDLRAFINKVGPALGDIYYGKNLDWKAIIEKSRSEAAKKTI